MRTTRPWGRDQGAGRGDAGREDRPREAVRPAARKAKGRAAFQRFELDDGVPVFEVFVLVTGTPPRYGTSTSTRGRTGKIIEMESRDWRIVRR